MTDWLNGLVYEMATRKLVFSRFAVRLDGQKLAATAWEIATNGIGNSTDSTLSPSRSLAASSSSVSGSAPAGPGVAADRVTSRRHESGVRSATARRHHARADLALRSLDRCGSARPQREIGIAHV